MHAADFNGELNRLPARDKLLAVSLEENPGLLAKPFPNRLVE